MKTTNEIRQEDAQRCADKYQRIIDDADEGLSTKLIMLSALKRILLVIGHLGLSCTARETFAMVLHELSLDLAGMADRLKHAEEKQNGKIQ
jgi:hypothetical protein